MRLRTHRRVRLGKHVERRVRAGAHRQVEPLAVRREGDVPPVVMHPGNPIDHAFGLAGGGESAPLVREPNHAVAVRDVDPPRVGPGRIERDAIRLLQATCKDHILCRLGAPGGHPQDAHRAEHAVGDEQVAVGRHANHARLVLVGRDELRHETVGELRAGIRRHWHHLRLARGGLHHGGEILCCDEAPESRLVVAPVAHRGLPSQHLAEGACADEQSQTTGGEGGQLRMSTDRVRGESWVVGDGLHEEPEK